MTDKKKTKKNVPTKKPKITYKKLRDDAVDPVGDTVIDLCCPYELRINPGSTTSVDTGLSFDVPKGYELRIRPDLITVSSGKIRLACPVQVRSGDSNSLRIPFDNMNKELIATTDSVIILKKGQKIAEATLEKLTEVEIVEDVKEDS